MDLYGGISGSVLIKRPNERETEEERRDHEHEATKFLSVQSPH